jgi:DNA-binding MarR family transcriptional regulator
MQLERRMAEDIIKQMGLLCLGSRLKRIGDRMQADVSRFIEDCGLDIQPAQYPLLAALDRDGPMTVSDLVEALGVSQPGVTRNVTRLADMGLVETAKGRSDQRHKTVALTKAGRQAVQLSKRDVWPHIEAAVVEVCAGLSGPLLKQLGAIEDALADAPLDRRAARGAKGKRAR